MTIAWMMYTMLITLLLLAGAIAAEFVCRAMRWPTRFVWCAAICLSIGLSVRALVRKASVNAPSTITLSASPPRAEAPVVGRPTAASDRVMQIVRKPLELPTRQIEALNSTTLVAVGRALPGAIVLASILGLCSVIVIVTRIRRLTRRLELRRIDGYEVLVSEDVGPALLGVFRLQIVLPRWVLALDDVERGVILEHERQHAVARDPILIAASALAIAFAPWNLALWAMFARLRLAIELDCDQRVLTSHCDARRYGRVLVTVYEQASAGRMQLAFVARRSNLERRIRRLMERAPRLVSSRGLAALATALVSIAAACETAAPTRVADSLAPNASIVGEVPRCIQRSGSVLARFEEMRSLARERHPELFAPIQGRDTFVGFLFDENCGILRDTVLSFAGVDSLRKGPSAMFAKAFRDTIDKSFPAGMTFVYSREQQNFVTVGYAVRPSAAYRARIARTPCGFGIRFDEICSISGPLELRMLDSVHALVAVRRFHAPNKGVDNLFLITLSRPRRDLATQSMLHATVAYQSGAVYVDNLLVREPRLWLGTPTTKGLREFLRGVAEVSFIEDVLGIAHYAGHKLTLEQVAQLRSASVCAGPAGSCYEVEGLRVEFP
jgi:beta-lactamase regulating signal transducer with metallopeptidase domain